MSSDLCIHHEFKISEGADFLESSFEKGVYVITEYTIVYCGCEYDERARILDYLLTKVSNDACCHKCFKYRPDMSSG